MIYFVLKGASSCILEGVLTADGVRVADKIYPINSVDILTIDDVEALYNIVSTFCGRDVRLDDFELVQYEAHPYWEVIIPSADGAYVYDSHSAEWRYR